MDIKYYILATLIIFSHSILANSLLELTDDQFIRLLGKGIPDECVQYYMGDINEFSKSIVDLKIIDTPGYAARKATDSEQQATLNELITILEKRCYQDVKRVMVSNNYYKDLPKHLYADDFSDARVLERYLKLVGIN